MDVDAIAMCQLPSETDRIARLRRLPIGAEVVPAGVHFRVWAPHRKQVDVVVQGQALGPTASFPLLDEDGEYFSGLAPGMGAGARYRFSLDGGSDLHPDPASRFQPEGPHGPSQVIDPNAFAWTDRAWSGTPPERRVVYEMHIGTFTAEGSWSAAAHELPQLAALGITVLEIMPVADFSGRFGWGYDGVCLFAPTRLYGGPDDFRSFVDRAHTCGMSVILDVVYNHVGPDGSVLRAFSVSYFSDRYENEWGDPINYDGPYCAPVREFFCSNARYWIEEFHLDGLRLDATQQIFDSSPRHVVADIVATVRATAGKRHTFVVCENEPQDVSLVRACDAGGQGADALWNDDFHHAAKVALTGKRDAYYTDYRGSPQELVSALKWGFLYQGQHYSWQKKRRGTPTLAVSENGFVHYLQNHDQVANSAFGERLHRLCSPGCYRAMTAVLLLAPQTPMLFQGQEFGASAPFLFFADHSPQLAAGVRKGRARFLAQFPNLANSEMQVLFADPGAVETFERCKLDFAERGRNVQVYSMHRDLLRLRSSDPAFSKPARKAVDGAVLGQSAFVLRFFTASGDRLLIVNLAETLALSIAPEPLLAPSEGGCWRLLWSSDAPCYGGSGAVEPESEEGWHIAGQCAMVLGPA